MHTKPRIPPALWAVFGIIDLAIIGAVLAAVFWVAPLPPAFEAGHTLEQARAAHPRGLTVAVITADPCLACQMYKRGALRDERFTQWAADNAGVVHLKRGRDDAAIASLNVTGSPATVVMLGHQTMAAHVGLMSGDELMEFLREQEARIPEFQGAAEPDATP